jgi:cytochrome P450 family 135
MIANRTPHDTTSRLRLPSGPRVPSPLQAYSLAFFPGPFLEKCRRDYGDLFTLRVGTGDRSRLVVIADPLAAQELFRDPQATAAGEIRASMAPVFGEESVLLADGDEHMRRRRAMLPAFHGAHLKRQADAIVAATDREIGRWPLGKPFALRPRLQAITLEVMIAAVLGPLNDERRSEIGDRVDCLLAMGAKKTAFLSLMLPNRLRAMSARRLFAERRETLDAAILQEIAHRRAAPSVGAYDDALAHLISASDAGRIPPSDTTLCDQVRTLLLAGLEATSTSLAWTIEHLMHAPDVYARLRSEVGDDDGGALYADAVLTESMRLSAPIPGVQRQLLTPMRIGRYLLPRDTGIFICAYLIHRRPDTYQDPYTFNPGRFLEKSPAPVTWLPFGGGSRRCLGANFARFQMNIVLRRLLGRTRLRAASPTRREAVRRRGVVFAPANGTRVVLTERHAI